LQRKAAGIFSAQPPPNENGRSGLRIIIQPPHRGFHHPVGKRDLLELLNSIGPIARYGLRSIELARSPAAASSSGLVFGRYCAPGRIMLFEQPIPPWRIPGLLRGAILGQFQRAGAIVTSLHAVGATLIDWPGDTLRQFMLREIFLHELGHHVLQHYKGKRSVRIARARDHESFANLFVEKHLGFLKPGVPPLPIRPAEGRGAGIFLP
jgi:hypothetical protein